MSKYFEQLYEVANFRSNLNVYDIANDKSWYCHSPIEEWMALSIIMYVWDWGSH